MVANDVTDLKGRDDRPSKAKSVFFVADDDRIGSFSNCMCHLAPAHEPRTDLEPTKKTEGRLLLASFSLT
jgi:hypothetical protein